MGSHDNWGDLFSPISVFEIMSSQTPSERLVEVTLKVSYPSRYPPHILSVKGFTVSSELSEGITEDVTASFSRHPGMLISKDKAISKAANLADFIIP
jgi:hypothetical protein